MKSKNSSPGTQHSTPNQGGRPTKMKTHIITAFRELLEEDNIALACTDKELFFMLNLRLPEEDRVCYRTFQRYKAKAMTGAFDAETEPLYQHLFRLFYEALIRQKQRLVALIEQGGTHWQRFKWILERKFREWHANFALADEAKEEIPWEPSVSMIVPIVPKEKLDQEMALNSPMITLREWHQRFGDTLERPVDLDE